MADIIYINEISKQFKTIDELKNYCSAQYMALQSAAEKITQLQEKVSHLEGLLISSVDDNAVSKIIKTPELAICEAQIGILQNRALQKELTLEEVKTLDLLIKNKRLLSGESTTIDGSKKPKREMSEAQLISIARTEKKNG